MSLYVFYLLNDFDQIHSLRKIIWKSAIIIIFNNTSIYKNFKYEIIIF
jgi:hypothetical protein